jgi:hypothetical protein
MNTPELIQTNIPAKRPYAKPEIVYQQPLEAMAATCTGINAKSPAGLCTGTNFS